MDEFKVNNQFEQKLNKKDELSKQERDAFESELEEINRLIEQNLDDGSDITETKTTTIDPVKEPTNPTATIADKSNELGTAKWHREQLQRQEIFKNSDPHGKNKKASAEDI